MRFVTVSDRFFQNVSGSTSTSTSSLRLDIRNCADNSLLPIPLVRDKFKRRNPVFRIRSARRAQVTARLVVRQLKQVAPLVISRGSRLARRSARPVRACPRPVRQRAAGLFQPRTYDEYGQQSR